MCNNLVHRKKIGLSEHKQSWRRQSGGACRGFPGPSAPPTFHQDKSRRGEQACSTKTKESYGGAADTGPGRAQQGGLATKKQAYALSRRHADLYLFTQGCTAYPKRLPSCGVARMITRAPRPQRHPCRWCGMPVWCTMGSRRFEWGTRAGRVAAEGKDSRRKVLHGRAADLQGSAEHAPGVEGEKECKKEIRGRMRRSGRGLAAEVQHAQ